MQTLPSKEAKEVYAMIRPHGWTWEMSKGHLKFRGPDGGLVIAPSSKFSDKRVKQNLIRDLKRQGCPL